MSLRRLLQLGQHVVPKETRGVVVLGYHLVGGGTQSPVDLPVSQFARQLDHLAETCNVIGLEQALRDVNHASPRPRVVLSFDDAYRNFASVVWPMLRERALPSILYVPVGFVSGTHGSPIRGTALPACSWSELRELQRSGVEIGSHGVAHLNLKRLDDQTLEHELAESRATLQRELGGTVPSFCYIQGKHSSRVVSAVRRHYSSAVAGGGQRFLGADPFRIPRFPVRRDDTGFDRMLTSRLWITEAVANQVRQLRP
jgi:peptidoglycan/xylan/chitin deacetylase (PgdA/CDA1 family)